MEIEVIRCLADNLCYLIGDRATNSWIMVDGSETAPLLKALSGRPLAAVLLTHHHHDHVGGLSGLPPTPLFCSARDAGRVPAAGGGPIHSLRDLDSLSWLTLTGHDVPILIQALHIPGHTEGQVAFLLTDERTAEPHVFVGDTLFSFGCGRCLEGTPEQLFDSLCKIKKLAPGTRLHFGHEYSARNIAFLKQHSAELDADGVTTEWKTFVIPREDQIRKAPRLSEELRLNPFLQLTDVATFTRWRRLRDLG